MKRGRWRAFSAVIFAVYAVSCGKSQDDRPTDAGQVAGDGAPQTVCASDGGVESAVIDLPGCDGLPPGTEACHARIFWDSSKCCADAPCDRLLVYWSGGEQACDDGNYDNLIKKYAGAGFVAACAQPYTNEDEAGLYPVYREFDRMDHLISAVRAEVASLWNGKNLLISGVSHGGTAPLVTIANQRALRDHAAVWTGSEKTAVVLFDGISNPADLEEWSWDQGVASGCRNQHKRWVQRYEGFEPLIHSCANDGCYCSDPPNAAEWAKDTVVIGETSPPSPYQCDDFTPEGDVLYRFVSCGGSGAACGATGDWIPDEQQTEPYAALQSCDGVTASYADYPSCPHITCGKWDECGGADAVAWLEANGW